MKVAEFRPEVARYCTILSLTLAGRRFLIVKRKPRAAASTPCPGLGISRYGADIR